MLLTALYGGAAVALIAAPSWVAETFLRRFSDVVADVYFRRAGAALLMTAAVTNVLGAAAEKEHLHMETYKRLNIGLMIQASELHYGYAVVYHFIQALLLHQ